MAATSPARSLPSSKRGDVVSVLQLRDMAAAPFISQGWSRLYAISTSERISVTLLDPSERLQLTLQLPLAGDSTDWDLWLEACEGALPAAMGQPLRLSDMVDVARWLQGPIRQIEEVALASGAQVVLHMAGLGPGS
ncbi:hypothetical protein EVJ50_02745 [Synechococcus sp. RSCCF101]|uniref:hypothetical protein n=1 Tax=Synechococcus sp. RSCCF101 TaxID=2511069 RepID=UPI0012454107|nr:hypothetical protein [Synechococcus sp. RSCCF101]QEY31326.1 hypothetical protein EVJ50_02745 [Synechococcus sp. RSCCF101]